MSWEDQGRQEHGWFGNGTAPPKFDDKISRDENDLFGPTESSERIAAVARGAIAALPSDLRARAATRNDPATVERLTEVMTAWVYGGALNQADFAERFLGRSGDDPVAGQLRAAASGAAFAKSHADLGEAASRLAKAMQAIGLDRWQRFLVDAQHRANDPATIAAVNKSRQPTDLGSKDDSIRPVYPVEALAAAAAAGIAAGGAAIVRSIGGTLLRQVLPNRHGAAGTPPKTQQPVMPTAGGSPTVRGLPPPNVKPPVNNSGKLKAGAASRPSEVQRGGQSLWDEHGGEWRYHPGDKWHNPHWDYNGHSGPNSPWQNIPINNLPPRKI